MTGIVNGERFLETVFGKVGIRIIDGGVGIIWIDDDSG